MAKKHTPTSIGYIIDENASEESDNILRQIIDDKDQEITLGIL